MSVRLFFLVSKTSILFNQAQQRTISLRMITPRQTHDMRQMLGSFRYRLPGVVSTYPQSLARTRPAPKLSEWEKKPHLSYDVPRNSNGSLPVYTDQINTKRMTLIRNVERDVHVSTPQAFIFSRHALTQYHNRSFGSPMLRAGPSSEH